MSKLIKGALIGGIVFFIWSAISHTVIPWHEATYSRFSDEDAVANVLKSHTSGSGVYIYPLGTDPGPNATSEQEHAAREEAWAKIEKGPMAFVVYSDKSGMNMATPLIGSLIITLITALLIMWLVTQTTGLSFWCKVGFIVLAGTTSGFMFVMQYWNWWSFPTGFVLLEIVDWIIGWFLAGMAMVKWGLPKQKVDEGVVN